MTTSYIVTVREKELDNKMWSILVSRQQLADLLANVDDTKYEIGDIIATYSDKSENIKQFCKNDVNLETGKEK